MTGIDELLDRMRSYLHLPDADHVLFALAIAVGAGLDGDPAWGMIVGPPSSAKTEAVRLVDRRVDERVDDLTPAALLSWTKGRKPRPTGILSRAGRRCFASVSDFSTITAATERTGENGIYALLRRAHDGRVQRDLGNAEEPLVWEGRLTLLAASTPRIDDFSAHADALGPRWVYLRLPNETAEDRAKASQKAREHPDLEPARGPLQKLAAEVVADGVKHGHGVALPESFSEEIDNAATVCALGRATVPRNSYGRREIIGLATIEGTPRIAKQLALIARAVLGLGVGADKGAALVRRVALDSIPQARRRVLEALRAEAPISTAEAARASDAHRTVARYALEELAAIGIVEDAAEPEDEEPSKGHRSAWRLRDDHAGVIRSVASNEVTQDSVYLHLTLN